MGWSSSNSLEVGEVGFVVDDVKESLLSKLVPYGLLSSSFHIMSDLSRDPKHKQPACDTKAWIEGRKAAVRSYLLGARAREQDRYSAA